MNYNETKDLTKQYLLARIPFIAINSIEKKRVERMFLELSKEIIDSFLVTKDPNEERHLRRVNEIITYENGDINEL